MFLRKSLVTLLFILASVNAYAEYTTPQIPIGIAVGPNQNIEVSFQNMTNSQGCAFNGAYVIDSTIDTDSKKTMVSLLLSAKAAKIPVRLRLVQCGVDRPKFNYVFLDANWL